MTVNGALRAFKTKGTMVTVIIYRSKLLRRLASPSALTKISKTSILAIKVESARLRQINRPAPADKNMFQFFIACCPDSSIRLQRFDV